MPGFHLLKKYKKRNNFEKSPFEDKKIIFHIDYDSFFASVEQQYNPKLRGKPIGVTGSSLSKGVICAASIEAKRFGVKTAMPVFKAKKICPQIITVKGDFEKYKYIHKKSKEILNKYTDLVEPFSIDEFFIDITKTLKFFKSSENIVFKIKEDIYSMFGPYITCSIGIGPNKLLAKLVSDFRKPNGFFKITPQNLKEVLHSTPLEEFCGIGPRICARLNKLNVHSIKDLQEISMENLYKEFGNIGSIFLKNLSFGIDNSKVEIIDKKHTPKSIGHQHTLNKNTSDPKVIKYNLFRLSEMVGRRLRRNDMMGKTISIYLRDKDFKSHAERLTINPHTDSSLEIYKVCLNLLKKAKWNKETRLVGVSISNLVYKNELSLPLFLDDQKQEKITTVSDLINDKFGEFTLIPANTLLADKTKGKISSFLKH